jgi:hypothetical protein
VAEPKRALRDERRQESNELIATLPDGRATQVPRDAHRPRRVLYYLPLD